MAEKNLENYVDEKASEFKEIIDGYASDLSTTRASRGGLGKVDIEIRHVDPYRARSRRGTSIFALDILSLLLAPIMFIIPFFRPEWQVAYAFGAVLIFSVFSRSILLRIAALVFTSLAMIFGVYVDAVDIVMVVFGLNTITLGPMVVAILMTALAAGSGVIHGLAGSTRYSGVWIIALGFLMASLDTLIAFFTGVTGDWLILLTVHLVIYLSAFVIAWGLFYLLGRGIRWAILAAKPRGD
jgi:hypothetical protein